MGENKIKLPENLLSSKLFFFSSIEGKHIKVSLTAFDLSFRKGLLLLREYDHRLDFTDRLDGCIEDKRRPWMN